MKRSGNYHRTHGMAGTPEWKVWRGIIARCHIPSATGYHRYGARGIYVCDEWRNDFAAFYAHIGPRPSPSHSVDRVDNERGYEPGNVRWATRKEQGSNTRRNRIYRVGGKSGIADDIRGNIALTTFKARIMRGWSPGVAIAIPVRPGQRVKERHVYCPSCGNHFLTFGGTARYCSPKCKQASDTFRKRLEMMRRNYELGLGARTLDCELLDAAAEELEIQLIAERGNARIAEGNGA